MTLDATLWEVLEAHGVTTALMDKLRRLMEAQENGEWTWHLVGGRLKQCDLRIRYSADPYHVTRVENAVLDGESVVRS
jgi:hypothetical protein